MKKNTLGLILMLVALGAVCLAYGLHQQQGAELATGNSSSVSSFDTADDLGTYKYKCQDGTIFNAHFLDAQHLTLIPIASNREVPQTILTFSTTSSGTLYGNREVLFYGHGETVQLTIATTSTNCSPETLPDEAPMNFGD
jgi:membrane-bound inhibitor of C-type lysozyme